MSDNDRRCDNCGAEIRVNDTHCENCSEEWLQDEPGSPNRWAGILGFFCGSIFLLCLLLNYTRLFSDFEQVYVGTIALTVLTLIFGYQVRKEIYPLLRWDNFSLLKASQYAGIAVLVSLAINYALGWLNKLFFHHSVYHLIRLFHELAYPKVSMLIFIILQPALVEEIAFRGIIQEGLLRITTRRQAILMMAFLFAIIHMSLISFFWLVPFAIWLGYLRMKENTIWYGVLIHCFFNATACLFDIYHMGL